jgi:cytochrome P450
VLLGPAADPALAPLLTEYFQLRREAASPAGAGGAPQRERLLAAGAALDGMLRRHLRRHREPGAGGLLARLLSPQATAGVALSEDEAVGHANILFVSATEPVAVALTWTLLLLSQLPALRQRLRQDPAALTPVLLETLRLLPPNGFMVRLTSRPVQVGGRPLPAHCEVILCPLLAHRDAAVFARPAVFLPQRWQQARPTPFEYFPFGAGGHACVGRSLGMDLLHAALGFVLQRFDTVLAADQAVDWRIHIQFMPREDIAVRFVPAGQAARGGRCSGPVAALVDLGG